MKKSENVNKPTLREFLSLMEQGTEQIISLYVTNDGRNDRECLEISVDLCLPLGYLEKSEIAYSYEADNGCGYEVSVDCQKLFEFFLDKRISHVVPLKAIEGCDDDCPIEAQVCVYFLLDDDTPDFIVQECFKLEKEQEERFHRWCEEFYKESRGLEES